jgi:hypothetical protein
MNSQVATETAPQIPLLIGVSGHRDLVPEQVAPLRTAVRRFLQGLQQRFPQAPLRVVSSLAEGADLLVVEEALALNIECIAVLPLPLELFRADFADASELGRFEQALERCRQQIVCPMRGTAGVADLANAGPARAGQYALASELIASHAFIMIALWDGRPAENPGGTAYTVRFRLERRAWLDSGVKAAHQELLPNLPPDLIYHIVAGRRSSPPAEGLIALQEGYRHRTEGPLEADLPATSRLIAQHTAEINRDFKRYAAQIAKRDRAEALTSELAAPPSSIVETARIFGAIDWMAGRMRRNVMRTLRATSALMVLMGVFFLLYHHAEGRGLALYSIFGFVASFLVLLAVNFLANSRDWHRRYLEFRALAEALRVELFWAIAGVGARDGTAAAHRALLKQADPGLEWIPNAIRAASLILNEVRHAGIPGGIDFAMRNWVGTTREGGSRSQQLHYYWQAGRRKAAFASFAEHVAGGSVIVGFLVACILAGEELLGRGLFKSELLFSMGFFSLVGGVIEALVQKTADRELQRQYAYMYEVFQAARDRLMGARSDDDRRTVLALLGRAALAEHAAWLLIHRDRPIDRSRIQ